jgi:hypothetical protein
MFAVTAWQKRLAAAANFRRSTTLYSDVVRNSRFNAL